MYLAEDHEEKSEILRSYFETYLAEEIELEAGIRNLGGFLRFLPIAAAQNGEITNYSNIGRETGVKNTVVKEYYKILEDTLIGFFLLPYSKSIRKKMTKHPKFYFFDTGIVSAINKRLRVPLVESNSEYGRAFEHLIICEIIRLNEYKRADLKLSFYRTENGAEVDLIIEFPGGRVIALEIKATSNPSPVHCSGLRSFKEKVPDAELLLACRADRARKINDVTALPWPEALQYVAGVL